METKRDAVTDPWGNGVGGAEIAVYDAHGDLASLYDAEGAALLNPFTTDPLGNWAFQAANGRYTVRINGTGLTPREFEVILQDPAQLVTAADLLNDYVVSGLLPAVPAPASLGMTTPPGVAYIGGTRVAPPATARTYTASKDTYVDLSSAGAYTYSELANGAAAPAVAVDSIRLFKVVTNGTEITGVTDLRALELVSKSPVLAALPSYTVAALPSAATYARALVYVSNEEGGAVPAFSDGANWRRVTDRAVVS